MHLQEYTYETHDQNRGAADGRADGGDDLPGAGFRQSDGGRNRGRVVYREIERLSLPCYQLP